LLGCTSCASFAKFMESMPIGIEKVVTTVGTIVARGMVCQCLLVPCGQFLVDVRQILDLGIDARMSLISISIRPTGLAAAVVLDGTLQTVDMPLVGFDVASGHFLLALLTEDIKCGFY